MSNRDRNAVWEILDECQPRHIDSIALRAHDVYFSNTFTFDYTLSCIRIAVFDLVAQGLIIHEDDMYRFTTSEEERCVLGLHFCTDKCVKTPPY